jgi:hypothetical protein
MPICYVRIIWFDIIVDYIVILSVFFFFFGQVPFTTVIMPNFSL